MNGLRTTDGIDLELLDSLEYKYNFNRVIEKWNDLTVENNFLKLKNNNFMLLDEITADLFL